VAVTRPQIFRDNLFNGWGGIGGESMSKLMKLFAGIVLAAGILLAVPGSAQAGYWFGGWGPYLYYGWPYQPYSFNYPRRYYYDAPAPECGWVRVRSWHRGHRYWRRVWRCQ
jgi:hypothetical protein